MVKDDRPMLPIDENGIALYRSYGSIGTAPHNDLPSWQIALLDWWNFIDSRQAMILIRRISGEQASGSGTPSCDSDPPPRD